MPDDLESAKAEFLKSLPGWWYAIGEADDYYTVTLGRHADTDDVRNYKISKPCTCASALRQAVRNLQPLQKLQ